MTAGTYAPRRWLGAPSPFGLALPEAIPSASTMYAPRGVCQTPDALIVADTGNHRLLIWHTPIPGTDHGEADEVVGQPDMTSEGPKLFFLPTGVVVAPDGRLLVADAWHHRILVWDSVADAPRRPPSMVLGQPPGAGLEATGEACGPQRFYWPFGLALIDGALWVADTGNRRVVGWLSGIPEPGQGADVVLGQPDLWANGENRNDAVAADSMRWPHAIASSGDLLLVADAGNHRVVGWRGPVDGDRPADVVIGQRDLHSAVENPYRPQGPRALRFPYAVAAAPDGRVFVADTSNNRVLVVDDPATTFGDEPAGAAFDRVLGQPSFEVNGENRWNRVEHDTLCWPYGLSFLDGRLAVADSGNNRVMIWDAP